MSRSSPSSKNRRGGAAVGPGGFTLIEVLVAVGLSAVIITALYATFFGVFRAADATEERLDKKIEAGRLLDRLGRDVRGTVFEQGREATRFVARRTGGRMELSFATTTGADPAAGPAQSDHAGVRYFLAPARDDAAREGAGGAGLSLYRESWDLFVGERSRVELLRGVSALGLYFYDGREWSGAWDSELDGGPPRAVRLEVELDDGTELLTTARVMAR